MFKSCAPFTSCINEINFPQVENVKDIDVVMPMHNLTEYSNNYAHKYQKVYENSTKI